MKVLPPENQSIQSIRLHGLRFLLFVVGGFFFLTPIHFNEIYQKQGSYLHVISNFP